MRLAIIGSYGHVNVVMKGLAEAAEVELVAAARWGPEDTMRAVTHYAGDELPIYDDYRRMLEEVSPDVVGVFMPLYRLAAGSLAAIERGCHVFSEKPLATTLEDLARLRQAADGAGVQVAACFTARGEPAFRTIRKAVADGRIGQPIYATAQKSYPFKERDDFYKQRETYGGSIAWAAIHALDYIAFCTGQDYRRVAAVAGNIAHPTHPGMEDQGGLLAELSGGGAAVINFDYLRPWGAAERPHGDDRLRIAGTEGIIETRDAASAVELMTPDAVEMLPLEPERNIFADWAAALAGEAAPPVTTAESFRITEVALKARDAQDSGQFVEV